MNVYFVQLKKSFQYFQHKQNKPTVVILKTDINAFYISLQLS